MDKKVSVIIPNYNYARFLQRRIDCIVNQTIKPAEIIFLDDCSSDDSLKVAEEILSKTDIPYQIIANATNQGVFKQWLKGIELIQHDYFWIAEADDYCELNFLETLLPAFDDKDVVLANCESHAVEKDLKYIDTSISLKESFVECLLNWSEDFKLGQDQYIKQALILNNSIYNVSSVLFNKKLINISILKIVDGYRFCGDWLFYILSLNSNQHNKLVHYSKCLNYHITHSGSVFGGLSRNATYTYETLKIYNYILDSYDLNLEEKGKLLARMFDVFFNHDYSSEQEAELHEFAGNYRTTFFEKLHAIFEQKNYLFMKHVVSRLLYDNGKGFNWEDCIIQNIEVGQNKFVFNVEKLSLINKIRLDLINQPAKIKFTSGIAKLKNGDTFQLTQFWHNGEYFNELYDFKHPDPQFIFDIPDELMDKINSFEFEYLIEVYNKQNVLDFLADRINNLKITYLDLENTKLDLENTKLDLENTRLDLENTKLDLENTRLDLENTKNELLQCYSSNSWKLTLPLRYLSKILKRQ